MAKIISVNTVEKTFTVAGVSDLNGVYKLRVANSTDRVKVLMRNGHEDIRLIELPNAMTKAQAVSYLMSLEHNEQLLEENEELALLFSDVDAQQAFSDFLGKAAPKVVAKAVITEEVNYSEAAELLEAELAAA